MLEYTATLSLKLLGVEKNSMDFSQRGTEPLVCIIEARVATCVTCPVMMTPAV